MRIDSMKLALPQFASQAEQGSPTAAPGWAPSAVWILLREHARASRKVRA
jgi:hypothetical protein